MTTHLERVSRHEPNMGAKTGVLIIPDYLRPTTIINLL
jgi:hypothetical protein